MKRSAITLTEVLAIATVLGVAGVIAVAVLHDYGEKSSQPFPQWVITTPTTTYTNVTVLEYGRGSIEFVDKDGIRTYICGEVTARLVPPAQQESKP